MSRTTGAARERVTNSDSMSRSRRLAIAIERVRWPSPVPFDDTNMIRGPAISPASRTTAWSGAAAWFPSSPSSPGSARSAREPPGARPPRVPAPAPPSDLRGVERRLDARSGRPLAVRRSRSSSPWYAAPPSSDARSSKTTVINRASGIAYRAPSSSPLIPRSTSRSRSTHHSSAAARRGGAALASAAAAATSRPSRTTWTKRDSGTSRASVWASRRFPGLESTNVSGGRRPRRRPAASRTGPRRRPVDPGHRSRETRRSRLGARPEARAPPPLRR